MSKSAIKIVYIAGQGRSGSTVLDRVLGSICDVTSCNEIYRIIEEGFHDNRTCSCLNKFYDCPFWSSIASKMNLSTTNIQEYLYLQNKFDRTKHIPFLKYSLDQKNQNQELLKYKNYIRQLYFSIAEASGSNILVDSSKNPSRALILSSIPEFEVSVIHLIRDVRAVAYSWLNKKLISETGIYLDQYSIYKTCLNWISRNIFSEVLGQSMEYRRVRYEDFCRSPRLETLEIIRNIPFLGDRENEVSKIFENNRVFLKSIHSIAGNPDRYKTGTVVIKPDNRWKDDLSTYDKYLIKSITFPLLIRYGYI